MILKDAAFDRFLKKPDAAVGCVLVYGPDQGLVRERADLLVRSVVEDPADPFRVVELTGGAIKADPARLYDEAAALSLIGGRRVVRVRDIGDAGADTMAAFLADGNDGALVVVEAGDLAKRSSLRAAFEQADRGAAVPCYADDEGALKRLIQDVLKPHRVSIAPEALDVCAQRLGADRAQSRGEIEKLAMYVGDGGTAGIDDVLASVGDTAVASTDDVVFAAFDGNQADLDKALLRAVSEGVSPIPLLRAATRHLERLLIAKAAMAQGAPAKQAMDRLRPPVFFKVADRFRRQLETWSDRDLAAAIDLAIDAEIDCKTTGMPADAVTARAMMRIAQAARRGRRR